MVYFLWLFCAFVCSLHGRSHQKYGQYWVHSIINETIVHNSHEKGDMFHEENRSKHIQSHVNFHICTETLQPDCNDSLLESADSVMCHVRRKRKSKGRNLRVATKYISRSLLGAWVEIGHMQTVASKNIPIWFWIRCWTLVKRWSKECRINKTKLYIHTPRKEKIMSITPPRKGARLGNTSLID